METSKFKASFIESAEGGVRFKLFVQPRELSAFREPETITISTKYAGKIADGPEDSRMYVVDAKKKPYDELYEGKKPFPRNLSSDNYWSSGAHAKGGHFDHLDPDQNKYEFECAAMYATVARVLDVWEKYFGTKIDWPFSTDKLEMIPHVDFENAQSGDGFLEFGYGKDDQGNKIPYCLNFDVLAHEVGHSIIFSKVGYPSVWTETLEYGGFHESCGDLVALFASLHFDKMVNVLLKQTSGNLFTANVLSRLGDLGETSYIRLAFNNLKMTDVTSEPHDLSQPLTGAIFDVFAEIFLRLLVERGLIDQQLQMDSQNVGASLAPDETIHKRYDDFFNRNPDGFKQALIEARDIMGKLLSSTWSVLAPDNLRFSTLPAILIRMDKINNRGANVKIIQDCFKWREIRVGNVPQVEPEKGWEWLATKKLNKVSVHVKSFSRLLGKDKMVTAKSIERAVKTK